MQARRLERNGKNNSNFCFLDSCFSGGFAFFWGQGGILAAAATEDDPKVLEEAKLRIAKRWSKDEAAFLRQEISSREWEMRKELLTNRFLDTARRLDFIRGEQ